MPQPTSSDTQLMRVHVLFFGAARDAVGHDREEIELSAPGRAADAFARVLDLHPDLKRFGRSLLLAVNQEYSSADREIHEGDELAVFPPVSGGSEVAPTSAGDSAPAKDF